MIVLTSDLYTVRNLILQNRVRNMSLDEIDDIIAYNAKHEFIGDHTYERLMEAKRNGTDSEATGSDCTMH